MPTCRKHVMVSIFKKENHSMYFFFVGSFQLLIHCRTQDYICLDESIKEINEDIGGCRVYFNDYVSQIPPNQLFRRTDFKSITN